VSFVLLSKYDDLLFFQTKMRMFLVFPQQNHAEKHFLSTTLLTEHSLLIKIFHLDEQLNANSQWTHCTFKFMRKAAKLRINAWN